jgi:hypothetical protein
MVCSFGDTVGADIKSGSSLTSHCKVALQFYSPKIISHVYSRKHALRDLSHIIFVDGPAFFCPRTGHYR